MKRICRASSAGMLDENEHVGEEFDYLAPKIIRTENFDMDELQTFLVLWRTGHIAGTSLRQRPYLERQSESAT